ncbi:phosphatidylinositol N-acetylglucosaminyltransferase subunit Q-like isoform X1 [Watersipora subatra]|uniref:phosphatidylinositol N-acetylglucosaminyltransferase subunit Q-like isoform X1 n=1 Tax=Watersipora subatra TaxID=2589382 RepID=UPI00355B7D98
MAENWPLHQSSASTPKVTEEALILLSIANDGKAIRRCYVATAEPVTVIVHEYNKCSKTRIQHEDEQDTLSYRICRSISKIFHFETMLPETLQLHSSSADELLLRAKRRKEALQSDKDCYCKRNSKCTLWLVESIINILVGILFIALVIIYGETLSLTLSQHMEKCVNSMILLLDWLMGVPAGLKLNYNLAAFLSRFFAYHIWLWAGYLKLAGKYFDVISLTIFAIGLPGGASLQVAILQDALKVFLLHMYCFYIYSSRLYSLTCYALLSLWRLFRGLKWNILRQRVDHASYDSTQLFIGTLLFAILLFTLPTVFLYHLVFATLRACILAFLIVLDAFRKLLNQIYTLVFLPLFCLISRSRHQEDYGLAVQLSSKDNVTILTLRHDKGVSCPKCLKIS